MSASLPARPLPTWKVIAFVGPAFFYALIIGPAQGILPTLYTGAFGIESAAIGLVLLFTRLADALLDPAIGFLSDRTKSRYGRRKPWIFAGAVASCLGIYFLFVPPANANIWHFAIWLTVVLFAWSLVEIPHTAWTVEITSDYHQRSRIISFKSAIMYGGMLAFMLTPLLPIFSSSEINFDVLRFVAVAVLITMPMVMAAAFITIPAGNVNTELRSPGLKESVKALGKNGPLRIFCVAYLGFQIAVGVIQTTGFLYFTSHLQLGDKAPYIFGAALTASLISFPAWLRLSYKLGKKAVWCVGMLGTGLALPGMALISPGPDAFIPYLILDVTSTVFYTGGVVASAAILPDVVDYDAWKFGINRSGQFASFQHFILKSGRAAGSALAFLLLGAFGYEVFHDAHSQTAIFGVKFVTTILPPLILFATIPLVWIFPITERHQRALRKRLDGRSVAARQSPQGDEAHVQPA